MHSLTAKAGADKLLVLMITSCRHVGDNVGMNRIIDALLKRRSVLANQLCEPGPNKEQLDIIL